MRKTTIIVGAILAVLAVNVAMMPPGRFIPPSRFFVNSDFTYKYDFLLRRGRIDYLVLGNSRTRAAIDPAVFADSLGKTFDRDISAHTLAVGGGYFPFYNAVVRDLIPDNMPRAIVLGVSPRDFNQKESRRFKVFNAMRKSSGFRLGNTPYAEPARSVEQKLADLTAALLPAVYYRENSLRMIVPEWLLNSVRPSLGVTQSAFKSHLWQQLAFATKDEPIFPQSSDEAFDRLLSFPQRFRLGLNWSAEHQGEIDANGFEVRELEPEAARNERTALLKKKWQTMNSDGTVRKYRRSDFCDPYIGLDTGPGSAHRAFLDFVTGQSIPVYLVFLPAIWLEDCENNVAFNQQILGHLRDLEKEYDGSLRVIDLNNAFEHNFKDEGFYSDLEHFRREYIEEVTGRVTLQIKQPPRN